MEFKSGHVLRLILNIGGDLSEIMTASGLWPRALEEFGAVEIPASEGPVAEVGHHIASSCITDEHL